LFKIFLIITIESSLYSVGVGKADVTGPVAQIGFMG